MISTPWSQHRTVVYDGSASKDLDRYTKLHSRFDDLWHGIEWKLCRKPETGTPRLVDDPHKHLIYVFPSNELAQIPKVAVLYSYSDNEVNVHAILVPESQDDEIE